VSFYAVAVLTLAVGRGSDWLFARYIDVFGLLSVVVRLFDPEYYPREELGSPFGYTIAGALRIMFWTSVFGVLFLRFVFRPRQPSNQAMQRQ